MRSVWLLVLTGDAARTDKRAVNFFQVPTQVVKMVKPRTQDDDQLDDDLSPSLVSVNPTCPTRMK